MTTPNDEKADFPLLATEFQNQKEGSLIDDAQQEDTLITSGMNINSASNDIKAKKLRIKKQKKKKNKRMSKYDAMKMGPLQKCLKHGKIPFKLMIHVSLVILIFIQVFFATVHRSSFVFHSTKALADRFLPDGYTNLQDDIDGHISADITTIDGFFEDLKKSINEYFSFVGTSTSIYFYFPRDFSKNYGYEGKRFNELRSMSSSTSSSFFNKINNKSIKTPKTVKKEKPTSKTPNTSSHQKQQKPRDSNQKLEPEPLMMECDFYPTNIRDILDTRNQTSIQFWPEKVFRAWPLINVKDYFVFNASLEDSTIWKEWWSNEERVRIFFDRVSSCKLHMSFQQLDFSEFSILDDQTSNSINLLFSNFMVPILRFFRVYEFVGYTIGECLQWNLYKHYNFEKRGGVIKLHFRYFFSWCSNIINIFHDFMIIQLFKPIFWISLVITILSSWSLFLNTKQIFDRLTTYSQIQSQVLKENRKNGEKNKPGKGILNECCFFCTHKCLCFPFCVFKPFNFFKNSGRSSGKKKYPIFRFVLIRFYELPTIFSFWVLVTFLSDVLNIVASVLTMIQIGFSMEVSFFLGLSALFSYVNIIRYLQFAPKFYVLLNALQRGFPAVIRFCLSALPLFFGFAIMGTLLFGDYSDYFNTFDQACVSLFALMNGDSVHVIFDMLYGSDMVLREFSRVFLLVFIIIFIFAILNVFILLMEDAYFSLVGKVESGGLLVQNINAPELQFKDLSSSSSDEDEMENNMNLEREEKLKKKMIEKNSAIAAGKMIRDFSGLTNDEIERKIRESQDQSGASSPNGEGSSLSSPTTMNSLMDSLILEDDLTEKLENETLEELILRLASFFENMVKFEKQKNPELNPEQKKFISDFYLTLDNFTKSCESKKNNHFNALIQRGKISNK